MWSIHQFNKIILLLVFSIKMSVNWYFWKKRRLRISWTNVSIKNSIGYFLRIAYKIVDFKKVNGNIIGCEIFEIPNGDVELTLKKNLGAILSSDTFPLVIQNFSRSASFYIQLEIASTENDKTTIITASVCIMFYFLEINKFNNIQHNFLTQDLEKYLRSKNASHIIEEMKRTGQIVKTSQNKIIRLSAAYLLEQKRYPTKEDKVTKAQTILFLFPQLKCTDPTKSDIVSFIPSVFYFSISNCIFYLCFTNFICV